MKTYSKLRGRIVEKYGSQRSFAKALGKTEQTVIAKLNGKSEFSKADIIEWCNVLEIAEIDIPAYFFAE